MSADPLPTPTLEELIVADLRDGFGAEDIAVRRNCPPDYVRRVIVLLRLWGRLTPEFFAPLTRRA